MPGGETRTVDADLAALLVPQPVPAREVVGRVATPEPAASR